MGALHNGHISLIETAKQHSQDVIVSIFVNPTQFGKGEDFDKYPKTIENDLEKCEKAGVKAVFIPQTSEIYPENSLITFNISKISEILCGKKRPGHFNGVIQVVTILFNIIQPDFAIFGEKDYQQLMIIKQLVKELHFPIKIISSKLIREKDGLAMSSRNRYLSLEERKKATVMYETFKRIKRRAEDAFFNRSALPVEFIEEDAKNLILEKYPDIKIDYIEIRNSDNLQKSKFILKKSRIFGAIFVGTTRLIDNMALN
jgi:pantoate--beta-alanine ligase